MTAEELLDLGYRSPAQAFHTLRAAIRGNLPRLEYRSLSADFRRRNGLSQLSYREFREDWHAENPWMHAALSSAEIIESELDPGGRRATLRVGVLGQEALIVLVAEDFVQLWDFDELRETTMDPARRSLLQVSVEMGLIADEVFSVLMGENVESRKKFIQTNARDVRFLDI